jgi:tetratricopeptide (TPR) repeat protein
VNDFVNDFVNDIWTKCVLVLMLAVLPGFPGAFADSPLAEAYARGIQKEEAGDCISAIFLFQDALEENPYFLDAKIALARCFYKTGNPGESERLLREALVQEKNNVNAANLLGKVLISLKKYGEAENVLRKALETEPVNIDTRYGLADLYRAMGDYKKAVDIYEDILRMYPREAWTYVHLGTCYTEMGDLERAGGFFRKAVSLDSLNPWIHINLGWHYYRMGVKSAMSSSGDADRFFEGAAAEAGTALEIQPGMHEAYRILASIDFYNGRYARALESYAPLMAAGGETPLLLYEAGYCCEMSGDLQRAAELYGTALSHRIDDEITRFRLEQVELDLNAENLSDPKRLELAEYHALKARSYSRRNLSNKAILQYRRAVQLNPLDPDTRLELADLMRSRGFVEQYLHQLRDIVRDTLDVNTVDINDRIEIYEHRVSQNLASRWRVNQYGDEETSPRYVPKTGITVAVFDGFLADDIFENYRHKRLSLTLSEMLALALHSYEKVQSVEIFDRVESSREALKRSRALGVDYYVTGELEEREDSLRVRLDLLTGVSGKLYKSYETYFTGNDRVFQTVVTLAENLTADLPVRGLIARLEGDRALINIGAAQGVSRDMEFHIVREGGLRQNPQTGEYVVDPQVILGNLKITEVDERVAEGVYTYTGIHNRVNVYDSVVLKEPEKGAEESAAE